MNTTTLEATYKEVALPKKFLVFARHVGPYQGDTKLFERLFNQVLAWIKKNNLFNAGMEAISVYHDDPESVPVREQRISVGFTIDHEVEGSEGIQVMELPAGKYLIASFEIAPSEYGEAWELAMSHLFEHGMKPADGPMYESYKNDPSTHPQGKHLVDICIALSE